MDAIASNLSPWNLRTMEENMTEKMIAPCGLDCASCEGYLATQANDMEALQRVVEHWRVEYNHPGMKVEYCICDGCLSTSGRLGGHCAECDIRACAIQRGVANCAHCPEYGCAKISRFIGFAPQARANLEAIRAGL